MLPPILDATCGSRMIWFDKNNPLALFVDQREVQDEVIWRSKDGQSERRITVAPDVIADFTSLPFADDSFFLVVFDPPHLLNLSEKSWVRKKYGVLPKDWEPLIKDGFWECMRVLKPNGTLCFKWSEAESRNCIPVSKVIEAIGCTPLFGTRVGNTKNTIWMTFMKGERKDE